MFSDSSLPILNGVSISVDGLVGELRNLGHSVHLYVPSHPNHRDSDPNTFRFRAVRTIWAPDYPLAIPPFYDKLLQFRKHQYDVIHTHTPFATGLVGLRWAESHEIPIVSTYHTLYDRYAHYLRFFPLRYARFRVAKHTNFYYNSVNHVITPSEASLKWLRRHSVTTPVSIIPTGLRRKTLFNRSEVRTELNVGLNHQILLFVGRLAKEKNLPLLFHTAATVFAKCPNAKLWLVGEGPYREHCTDLARQLKIGDRVRFFGAVPKEEVDRYYAAADLFVFPSITETQGLVVQEAMSHGLPAVAVAGGGASASIRDDFNGMVVKNTVEDFSEAIVAILSNREAHLQMSQNAQNSMLDLSLPKMAETVLSVYQEVLKARQGHNLLAPPAINGPYASS
jgi:glycosyltransferase involved in cell wall biosynthesis